MFQQEFCSVVLILAINILRDSRAINKMKCYMLAGSSYLTTIFFSLYKEAAGNSSFNKHQYESGSTFFRPAPWSGLETGVFAEGILQLPSL